MHDKNQPARKTEKSELGNLHKSATPQGIHGWDIEKLRKEHEESLKNDKHD